MSSKLSVQEKKIKEYCEKFFSKKTALIVTPDSMNRTSLKKLLIQFGMNGQKVHICESFQEAQAHIEQTRPNIIITNITLGKRDGLELLEDHLQYHPNRMEACFFVVTDDNSPSSGCMALDLDVDAVLVTPFTIKSLEETIIKSIKVKIKPSPYHQTVEKARACLSQKDRDQALSLLEESINLTKSPLLAKSLLGKIYREDRNFQKAENLLIEVLAVMESHYPALRELFLLYGETKRFSEQYNIACDILKHHPLNPDHIPDYTRLSIINSRYEDIMNYSKIFTEVKYANSHIQNYLSAGLAICGRFFVGEEKIDEAINVLNKSAQLSNGKAQIFESLVKSYLMAGRPDEAYQAISINKTDETDINLYDALEFEINSFNLSDGKRIEEGVKLLRAGNKEESIFKIVLSAMQRLNITSSQREDIEYEAKKLYPDFKL